MAPIGLVDPLDDFLAPLMLEVDVDIGRLLALARHEALEEQLVPDRIDRGHAEQEADAAVRRRTAPLAQDPARSEEHTSELQSLMRISYAVFCLKKKNRD